MAVFNYTARDAAGAVTEGTIEAPARRDALRKLQARGLKPVKVEESGAAVRAWQWGSAASGLSVSCQALRFALLTPQRRRLKRFHVHAKLGLRQSQMLVLQRSMALKILQPPSRTTTAIKHASFCWGVEYLPLPVTTARALSAFSVRIDRDHY